MTDDASGLIVEDAQSRAAKLQEEREQKTVDELDVENQARLERIIAGAHGAPIQFPPNLFESIKTTCYLEGILDSLGVLDDAKHRYAVMAAEVLDKLEGVAREAALRGAGQALDLSAVRDLSVQREKNRAQRRAEDRGCD